MAESDIILISRYLKKAAAAQGIQASTYTRTETVTKRKKTVLSPELGQTVVEEEETTSFQEERTVHFPQYLQPSSSTSTTATRSTSSIHYPGTQ